MQDVCKICEQVSKKMRRVNKMEEDIARWRREGNRMATIEKTQHDIEGVKRQVDELWRGHQEKKMSIC